MMTSSIDAAAMINHEPFHPTQNTASSQSKAHERAGSTTTAASKTHLVLIPSYNSGALLVPTVQAALAQWAPVWVVLDGSTDQSIADVKALARQDRRLLVMERPHNGGKGAAVLTGLQAASAAGFTHVLTMDADGQHPAAAIASFMRASQQAPQAMVLGVPQFDDSAPALRRRGRRVSNSLVALETFGAVDDSLFGFRVYPLAPLLAVLQRSAWMRGFDFDPEAAVRLVWQGVPAINVPAAVRYFNRESGGISHFHYLRDNLLLTGMHLRLLASWLWRWPWLLKQQRRLRPF